MCFTHKNFRSLPTIKGSSPIKANHWNDNFDGCLENRECISNLSIVTTSFWILSDEVILVAIKDCMAKSFPTWKQVPLSGFMDDKIPRQTRIENCVKSVININPVNSDNVVDKRYEMIPSSFRYNLVWRNVVGRVFVYVACKRSCEPALRLLKMMTPTDDIVEDLEANNRLLKNDWACRIGIFIDLSDETTLQQARLNGINLGIKTILFGFTITSTSHKREHRLLCVLLWIATF